MARGKREEYNPNRYVGPGSDAHAYATGNFESTTAHLSALSDDDLWSKPNTKYEFDKNPDRGKGHTPKYKK